MYIIHIGYSHETRGFWKQECSRKYETIWQMQYKVEKIWSEYKQLIILQWEVTLIQMQNKLLPLQNKFILNLFFLLKLSFTTYTAEQLVGVCKIYTVQNYISQNGNL